MAVRSEDVSLSRTSRYELEGRTTSFACIVTRDDMGEDSKYHIIWSLGTSEISNSTSDLLHVTLHRNMSGAVLVCQVFSPSFNFKKATWTLDVMYPPNGVTLDVNSTHSCESDSMCSADVTVGRYYRFTCNASGSNPASNITWLINTKGRWGTTQREIPADRSRCRQAETDTDWDTSSHINLQILLEDRHGSVACRVMFLDASTVFREIVMTLQVVEPVEEPRNRPKVPLPENPELAKWVMVACIPTAAIITACVIGMVIARKLKHQSAPRQPRPQADATPPSSPKEGESHVSEDEGLYQELPVIHDQQTERSSPDQNTPLYHTTIN
ncbi:uncharacterized protein LOC119732289 [Patiria miniata]|uniref:Ig-like domain-containing protein n=1 Tax=Patiria miniata TaxID=46514 RepID=A0A914ACM9_PATMI|nr:uncharacterized protein LOC119732289 [Patiria miniata]